eukprot:TRINITY_DN5145_c0_g1_i4.p1 TRINITY_DN5145_c0_g1~~TRINITY_DN5145_c0_g1_i4.p1  ORF type:complete len:342 (+),score=84.70 TRINITY_DN5145_c0_g1_i4:118-1143(+)
MRPLFKSSFALFVFAYALISVGVWTNARVDLGVAAAEIGEPVIFEAGVEWREIPDGEILPAGLEIRINLATGKKEARLITDPKHHGDHHAALALHQQQDESSETHELAEEDVEKMERKHEWWLKQQVDSANLVHLVQILQDPEANPHHRLDALNFISDIVHDVDHAKYLRAHALDTILQLANHTSRAIRRAAFSVISTASQNNPDLQKALHDANGVHFLVTSLSLESDDETSISTDVERNLENGSLDETTEEWPVVSRDDVRLQIVSALASLARAYPDNQMQLLTPEHLPVLVDLIREPFSPAVIADQTRAIVKSQGKLVQLMTDFMLETENGLDAKIQQR